MDAFSAPRSVSRRRGTWPGAQHTEPGRNTTGTGKNWVGPPNWRQST